VSGRLRLDVLVLERAHHLLAQSAQGVDAERQRRRVVVEPDPAFGGVEPMPLEPASDEPVRM
jgi:hypothetical protein